VSLHTKAQSVIEYGLIIALIVLLVLLGVTSFRHLIESWFASLAGHLTTVDT
jgi:Flp pilus assembly pilin Flp